MCNQMRQGQSASWVLPGILITHGLCLYCRLWTQSVSLLCEKPLRVPVLFILKNVFRMTIWQSEKVTRRREVLPLIAGILSCVLFMFLVVLNLV